MKNNPLKWLTFLSNFPLGICIGCISTFILFAIFDAEIIESFEKFYAYLFSLIASMLVAGVALSGVLYNIANQNLNEDQRQKRTLRAAKSVLPFTLSELIEISKAGVYNALEIHSKVSSDEIKGLRKPSDTIISSLKLNVEHSDPEIADRISQPIYTYQIASARLKEKDSYFNHKAASVNNAIDWAILYCLVENCFGYSRGLSETIPSSIDTSRTSAIFYTTLDVRHQIELTTWKELEEAWSNIKSDQDFDLYFESCGSRIW